MRGSKSVIDTFLSTRKTTQSPFLPDAAHARVSSRQNFVRIRLVTDIPYKAILRRIKNVVKRYGQFNGSQIGTEVPTRLRHCFDQTLAHIIGKPLKTFTR